MADNLPIIGGDGQEYTAATKEVAAGIHASRVQPRVSGAVDDIADVTLTASASDIAASDAMRTAIFITADPTNTANVRIGGASASSTRGFLLQPGQAIVLNTSGAVRGASVSGSQKVSVLLLKE